MSEIRPIASQRGANPYKMVSKVIDSSIKSTLAEISLDIYVDCVNAGLPLQDVLLAIYLSGLKHGVAHKK